MTSVEILVEGFALREASGVRRISSNVTLVQDEGVLVLVNLGASDRQQAVLDTLDHRGIEPGDIDSIVLTHLHIDHVGALGLFPGTSIIVPEGTATSSRLKPSHVLQPHDAAPLAPQLRPARLRTHHKRYCTGAAW
jgi:glyoxylase-like metal-dependent hydrolase (beta-lactamase superfamily II)